MQAINKFVALLTMIQVKHGRWFFMLNPPTSIYYRKMDTPSSTDQPRASNLQMARFLALKSFTTGYFTAKFSLPFEAGLPFCSLLTFSLLPSSFLLPPYSFFPFLFLVFLPEESKQKKQKLWFLPRWGDKTWNMEWYVNTDKCRVERIHSNWVIHLGCGLPGKFLEANLLAFPPAPNQVTSGSNHLIPYAFCCLPTCIFGNHHGGSHSGFH